MWDRFQVPFLDNIPGLMMIPLVGACAAIIIFNIYVKVMHGRWSGLVGADQFLATFSLVRVMWISGYMGTGKTLLGVALFHEMYKRKLITGVISNIPTTLPLPDWEREFLMHAGLLFDEAGVQMDARTSMANSREYGAYARKLDYYLISPSVIPVDKRIAHMRCERVFKLRYGIIPEIWIYRYTRTLGEDKIVWGHFALIDPSQYFGMYDTDYIPMDDGDIGAAWQRTVYEQVKRNPVGRQWTMSYRELLEHCQTLGVDTNGQPINTSLLWRYSALARTIPIYDNAAASGQEVKGPTTQRWDTSTTAQPATNGNGSRKRTVRQGDSNADLVAIAAIRDIATRVQTKASRESSNTTWQGYDS